jgi:adenine C2-methylase RlmN of 23S rRNA A2503 and tRNA A37
MTLRVLRSEQDASVNFVEEQLAGFLEARYVRRCADYFVCYLSSHSGCNRGCEFCHLTATGQTSFTPSTINDFVGQALSVFKYYRQQQPAKYMHYSFMARGEPLANPHLLDRGQELMIRLGQLARDEGLPAKFCVSSIMPQTLKKPLVDVFGFVSPTMYYSMYSVEDAFRLRWLPTAMPAQKALAMLVEYQRFSKKIVKIHFALIEGQNDSAEQVRKLCDAIDEHGLLCEFNLVTYNPATPAQGRESASEVITERLAYITERFTGKVKAVKRVGYDVKASCGMFVSE